MSSLVSYPDWNVFEERQTPSGLEILNPAAEVAALLQNLQSERDSAARELHDAREENLQILAKAGVYLFSLEMALVRYEEAMKKAELVKEHRHIRVIKDLMRDLITSAGLVIENPMGKSFNDVAHEVHVEGWRHSEAYTSEVVAEVMEPIIRYQGRVVKLGRVVMGAPAENLPEAGLAND